MLNVDFLKILYNTDEMLMPRSNGIWGSPSLHTSLSQRGSIRGGRVCGTQRLLVTSGHPFPSSHFIQPKEGLDTTPYSIAPFLPCFGKWLCKYQNLFLWLKHPLLFWRHLDCLQAKWASDVEMLLSVVPHLTWFCMLTLQACRLLKTRADGRISHCSQPS